MRCCRALGLHLCVAGLILDFMWGLGVKGLGFRGLGVEGFRV